MGTWSVLAGLVLGLVFGGGMTYAFLPSTGESRTHLGHRESRGHRGPGAPKGH